MSAQRRHVVFLIHGIRTQGEWQERAQAILEADSLVRIRPIRYEYFDLVRFLLPFQWFREKPVRRVAALMRDELSRGPTNLSVVAHSFGTYIVAKILEREHDIRFHRLLLCGCIIPASFEWQKYAYRLDSTPTRIVMS
jgi:pimeloyl-ACP methyl ester carboxylesterase